ncbi:integral membrane protein [Colletotrichum tofieldiae]|nr:integral membrane protein [Colletotrichum tofieldiae]
MVRQADVAAAAAPATTAPSPRDRITTHMNHDHKRELSFYLRHYAGLSRSAATAPWLKDVTLEGMTIAAGGLGGKEYHVAFDPPLTSWADGFDVVVFGAVAFYFVCWLTLGFVLPGTPIWSFLQTGFPGGPRLYRWLVKAIFLPVLGIHLTECYWFHRTRLQKHGIDFGTGLWWTWIGSLFFEGVCGFRRFDSIVAAKKKENENKSH